ncbi:MAG: hypothetical protein EBR82_64050, partial [Caulobacteraceae bacterium]|nr:hypothetical protein [Caulobacteraceae bacterium]
ASQFFLGASQATGGAAGGYQISRSLRFNASDSAYLSRTPAVQGNRKKWTWSGWLKKSNITATQGLFTCTAGGGYFELFFDNTTQALVVDDGSVYFYGYTSATSQSTLRDPSAWYHIVLALDAANATQADKLRLWINGRLVGRTAELVYDQEYNINVAGQHEIGQWRGGSYLSAYLADIHFIDGQSLDFTNFTETDATTGQLVPKAYTGSYGTNGFHLEFADNSAATATTLGKDTSGNSNNWTPNNLSVTAGAGNDSLVDVPTNGAQTDTGAGGEVRGGYCTWNPLDNQGLTLANGNLDVSWSTNSWYSLKSTIGVGTGKWYYEYTINSGSSNQIIGLFSTTTAFPSVGGNGYMTASASGWGYQLDGNKSNNNSFTSTGTAAAAGDVIMVAFDMDAAKVWFGKNGTWLNSGNPATGANAAFSNLSGTVAPAVSLYGSQSGSFNAGARSFAYTAPSGFKALCTANLPAPLVTKPNTVMDVKLYTGNGSTQSITGLGFSPDLVWIKGRSVAYNHRVFDTVRGTGGLLYTNTTDAETAQPNVNDTFSSFDSNGFSLGVGIGINESSATYAAWCWDAGSSTVSNTQGSITSTVRANATAGFSVVSFTPASSGAFTIGHGLGVAPSLVIAKSRNRSVSWFVYHSALSSPLGKFLELNSTAAVDANYANFWGTTSFSSTVFGMNTGVSCLSTDNMIAYCFAPVVGYSSFGSYTGNGSTDGPFVYTGFRP